MSNPTREQLIEEVLWLRSQLDELDRIYHKNASECDLWREFAHQWSQPSGQCPICGDIMNSGYKCTCGWDSSYTISEISERKYNAMLKNYEDHGTIYDKGRY